MHMVMQLHANICTFYVVKYFIFTLNVLFFFRQRIINFCPAVPVCVCVRACMCVCVSVSVMLSNPFCRAEGQVKTMRVSDFSRAPQLNLVSPSTAHLQLRC